MVERVPKWVKDVARAQGLLPALMLADGDIVLSVVPLDAVGPLVEARFASAAFNMDPDGCWQQVLDAFEQRREH